MTWEAVGAIGQVVSALALALVFLQVRQARDAVEISVGSARLEGIRDMLLGVATHPEIMMAQDKLTLAVGGTRPPFVQYAVSHGLTEREATQLRAWITAQWFNIESGIESVAHMSPNLRDELDTRIWANYNSDNRTSGYWFATSTATLHPHFVGYVQKVLDARAAKSQSAR
jgi:hypothetical protein